MTHHVDEYSSAYGDSENCRPSLKKVEGYLSRWSEFEALFMSCFFVSRQARSIVM